MNSNLIIDLDGTLVDDSERHWRVFEEITQSGITKEDYWAKRREGQTNFTIGLQLFDKITFDIEKFRDLIESKRFLELDVLIPLEKTLERLANRYQLTLCTVRTNPENCFWQLDRLKLTDYFGKIVIIPHYELNLENGKALILSRELTFSPNDSIIGDTEIDIATGKALSIQTIAVTSGIRNRQFLEERRPDQIIKDINFFG